MAVGSQKGLAGNAETLEVDLVANPIPGPREDDPIFGRYILKKIVVVGILETYLEHIVIDIADRPFGLHSVHAQRLELKVSHGSGRILGQCLIDLDEGFASVIRAIAATHPVRINKFSDNSFSAHPILLEPIDLHFTDRKSWSIIHLVYGIRNTES